MHVHIKVLSSFMNGTFNWILGSNIITIIIIIFSPILTGRWVQIPSLLDLIIPMFVELWCDYCRLVFHIEVSQVLVLEWVSPAIPDLSILPPPRDLREEGGLWLWTWPTLHVSGVRVKRRVCMGTENILTSDAFMVEYVLDFGSRNKLSTHCAI